MDPDTDIGPIITQEAQRRIEDLIQAGVDDGAALLLDGRYPLASNDSKNTSHLTPDTSSFLALLLDGR